MQNASFEVAVEPSEYMLRLAASSAGRAYKSLAVARLALTPGAAVLDLGCGPGADLPLFAQEVGSDGLVVGIDQDDTAVADAQRQVADLSQVRVQRGDVHALSFPDDRFDAIHADRVLQHVADPACAIAEAARVLRAGGRAVFAEPDWRTLVVDHPDPRLADAFSRYVNEHQIRNPRLGSQLIRLCQSVGLEPEAVIPITTVFDDLAGADQVLGFRRVTQRAVDRGLMSFEGSERWLQHLAEGPVFAAVSLFLIAAVKVPRPTRPRAS